MRLAAAVLSTLAVTAALPAQAQDAGDWIWRAGVHNVRPKSDNHSLVNVDAAAALTFNATYMVAPRWGVELLAALPFEHDINLNGGGKVAQTKHLPPTLSLQYHFNPNGTWRLYVGAHRRTRCESTGVWRVHRPSLLTAMDGGNAGNAWSNCQRTAMDGGNAGNAWSNCQRTRKRGSA